MVLIMQKGKSDKWKEYEEEKRPFDDVMRELLKAKPTPKAAKKPKKKKPA